MKKINYIFLLGIFILTFVLRVLYLPKNSLTFGYDQARDAIVSQQILKGDLKIQGPPASTPGLYHGVFYYYLLAPAYLIGHGSPVIVAYWIAFLNSLTVFIVFYLGYLLTKKTWVGFSASFLFAISFEATQYATWLSNPTIGIWTVPLIYLVYGCGYQIKINLARFFVQLVLVFQFRRKFFLFIILFPF